MMHKIICTIFFTCTIFILVLSLSCCSFQNESNSGNLTLPPSNEANSDLQSDDSTISSSHALADLSMLKPATTFHPSGNIECLADNSVVDGYSSDNGFYRFVPREDSSSNLFYIDYESNQEIFLCNQPNCAHNSDTCTSWYPSNLGIIKSIPVGNRLIILHGGSPSDTDTLGNNALAQIDLVELDGSQKKSLIIFDSSIQISSLPRGGYARDDENVYFVLTRTQADETSRTLCAVNSISGDIYNLYDFTEPEERIATSINNQLIVSYSPNAYNLSIDAKDLETVFARLNINSGSITPLFTTPYLSVGGKIGDNYYSLDSDGVLTSYNLTDGNINAKQAIQLPENFNCLQMTFDGCFDNHLLVHSYNFSESEVLTYPTYCAINVYTGNVYTLDWIYEISTVGAYVNNIVSETSDQFLFAYTQEELFVNLPSGYQISYPYPQYALIDCEDFFTNRKEYTIISKP